MEIEEEAEGEGEREVEVQSEDAGECERHGDREGRRGSRCPLEKARARASGCGARMMWRARG